MATKIKTEARGSNPYGKDTEFSIYVKRTDWLVWRWKIVAGGSVVHCASGGAATRNLAIKAAARKIHAIKNPKTHSVWTLVEREAQHVS